MMVSNKKSKKLITSMLLVLLMFFSPLVSWADDSLINKTDIFYVNDKANVLDRSLEEYIVSVNTNFSDTAENPQVVVVTVPTLGDMSIEEYAYKLFEKYEVGEKNYDNGVLILLAPNEREIRIEVGYGLEGAITDSKSGAIIDESIVYLSENDFTSAIEMIFNNICNEIALEYEYDSSIFEVSDDMHLVDFSNTKREITPKETVGIIILFFCFIILLMWDFYYNQGRISVLILHILDFIGSSRGGSSRRNSGGGGRSGGGGASRSF